MGSVNCNLECMPAKTIWYVSPGATTNHRTVAKARRPQRLSLGMPRYHLWVCPANTYGHVLLQLRGMPRYHVGAYLTTTGACLATTSICAGRRPRTRIIALLNTLKSPRSGLRALLVITPLLSPLLANEVKDYLIRYSHGHSTFSPDRME